MVPTIQSETDRIYCYFGPFFALSPPNNLENQNFEKRKKTFWRYHHFTHVYQKSESYDVCFLRYVVQQTSVFVILGHFLPFYPSIDLKY